MTMGGSMDEETRRARSFGSPAPTRSMRNLVAEAERMNALLVLVLPSPRPEARRPFN
jgi:hypothetical protein